MSYQPFATGRKRVTGLTNVAQQVFSVAEVGKSVTGIHINGGAAAEVVVVRLIGGGTIFRVQVGVAQTVFIPFAFITTAGGVEAITETAAGDVEVVMPFFD